MLKPLVSRAFSRIGGRFMDSRLSKPLIPVFTRRCGIDISQYEPCDYTCFNEFFIRRIRPENRPFDMNEAHLVSPCDGQLSAFHITPQSCFRIKNSVYSVRDLLNGDSAADHFQNGICLVFRLCVDNYHRYHYFDDVVKEENHFVPGKLHTVRPIALEHADVFIQNCREYTLLHTRHFGAAAQVEVGAMLVGRIMNHHAAGTFRRGEEKGMFLYGGSTIVLLLEENAAILDQQLFTDSLNGIERQVRCGQRIGLASDSFKQ